MGQILTKLESNLQAKSCPKVVVIVLNWNGRRNTCECLKSLGLTNYQNYETILVDNASTQKVSDLRMIFSPITLIENTANLGFGGGLNVGIREAVRRNADYVLCLNNDIVLDRDSIGAMVKIGELNKRIGGLCPMEYYYDEPNRINCAGGVTDLIRGRVFGHGKLDRGQFSEPVETRLLSGPAMMLKLEAVLKVGFFDETYFYGAEDQDLALRLMKQGFTLMFVPKAKLWHKGKGATGGKITALNVYFSVRSRIAFVRKHGSEIQLAIFVFYFGFFDLPSIILKCARIGDFKNCVRAAIKGIVWHADSALLPPDHQIVSTLCRERNRKRARIR